MKTTVINQDCTPVRASIGRCLLGALVVVGLCMSPSLAQQADSRGATEPAARSARGGPSQSEAKLPPGQRMLRRVLRDAFPRPAKAAHRAPPSTEPSATGAAIPARNSIGSRLTTPTTPVDTAHKPPSAMPMVPNAATASAPPANNGSLAAPSRNAASPPVPPVNRPRPGGIDGTALVRSGTAPAGIGGPARSTTGINGTNVQLRRQH
jgi:hypothetical protein